MHKKLAWLGCIAMISAPVALGGFIDYQEGNLKDNGVVVGPGYTTDAVFVKGYDPTVNQDGLPAGDVQVVAGQNGGTGTLRGLLKFDMSLVNPSTKAGGGGFTITGASMTLRSHLNSDFGSATVTYNLYLLGTGGAAYNFSENTVTWNSTPLVAGGTTGTLLSSLSFDPTGPEADRVFPDSAAFRTALTDALTTGDSALRFLIKSAGDGTTSFDYARFYANEAATVAYRPLLHVDYSVIPEPATLLSLTGVLALMTGAYRRRS